MGALEDRPFLICHVMSAIDGRISGSSVAQLRQFHQDFENALMPAVEGKYKTYAASPSDADLKASRDHRAFGGFGRLLFIARPSSQTAASLGRQ